MRAPGVHIAPYDATVYDRQSFASPGLEIARQWSPGSVNCQALASPRLEENGIGWRSRSPSPALFSAPSPVHHAFFSNPPTNKKK